MIKIYQTLKAKLGLNRVNLKIVSIFPLTLKRQSYEKIYGYINKKDKKPTSTGIIPSEIISAIGKEDVLGNLYNKLNLSKEEFYLKYEIIEIIEINSNIK
jgi:hypothetical protein